MLLVLNVSALNLFWGRGRGYALWLLGTVEAVDLMASLALSLPIRQRRFIWKSLHGLPDAR